MDVVGLIKCLSDEFELISEHAPADRMDESLGVIIPINRILQSSVETLSDDAQRAFAFLGAFAPKPATFDLTAMSAVWEISELDTIAMMRILVGRGLLEALGNSRFQMHATLSMYARSLLNNLPERELVY